MGLVSSFISPLKTEVRSLLLPTTPAKIILSLLPSFYASSASPSCASAWMAPCDLHCTPFCPWQAAWPEPCRGFAAVWCEDKQQYCGVSACGTFLGSRVCLGGIRVLHIQTEPARCSAGSLAQGSVCLCKELCLDRSLLKAMQRVLLAGEVASA